MCCIQWTHVFKSEKKVTFKVFYRLNVQVNVTQRYPSLNPLSFTGLSNICLPRRRWHWPDTDCLQRRWCWSWRCCRRRRLWWAVVRWCSRWTGWTGWTRWRWDQWRCCWSSVTRWSECFWRWSCETERPTPSEWRPWSGSHLQGEEEKVWRWFTWNLKEQVNISLYPLIVYEVGFIYFVYRRVLFFFHYVLECPRYKKLYFNLFLSTYWLFSWGA